MNNTGPIDLISAYCDRWCERCAFSSRCSVFVGAKLHRALVGRDRHRGDGGDDPVQNDWNGSAKIALLSLERAETAWRAIVQATADPVAVMLADGVRDLRRLVQDEFPRAM